MKKFVSLITFMTVCFILLSGCVKSNQPTFSVQEYTSLNNRLTEVQNQLDEAKKQVTILENETTALGQQCSALRSENSKLEASNTSLKSENSLLQNQLKELIATPTFAPTTTPPATYPPSTTSGVINVTAEKLSADYSNNKLAADVIYLKKKLRVIGKVNSIDRDYSNKAYIILDDGTLFFMSEPRCYFESQFESQLLSISKGQIVTVEGWCQGNDGFYTELGGCILIQ